MSGVDLFIAMIVLSMQYLAATARVRACVVLDKADMMAAGVVPDFIVGSMASHRTAQFFPPVFPPVFPGVSRQMIVRLPARECVART
ncbi:hypothetical protein WBP07_04240 [Novosphingobium sp. BL-8A]|uniref:hypothetical protein n=1 Tax=Novosphingobium sp. BL-8A TaxID=3127639 RepID=UPI0037581DC3